MLTLFWIFSFRSFRWRRYRDRRLFPEDFLHVADLVLDFAVQFLGSAFILKVRIIRHFLMAAEMDDRIQAQTGGKKSLRDAFRALLTWSATNRRAIKVEEMTQIISQSTAVDVRDIVAHWMQAPLR